MSRATPAAGGLDQVPLPHILRSLYLARASGVLELNHQRDKRIVALVDGEVRSARCNRLDKRVGQFALANEVISRVELMRALSANASKLPLGQRLVSAGALRQEDLDDLLKELVKDIVIECFGWREGEYAFKLGKPSVPAEVEIRVSTADLIRLGFLAHADRARAVAMIGDLNHFLVPNPNIRLLFQHVDLDEEDRDLLHCVDGHLTAAALAELPPAGPDATLVRLAALVACGLLSTAARPPAEELLGVFPTRDGALPAAPAPTSPPAGPPQRPGRRPAMVPGAAPPPPPPPVAATRAPSPSRRAFRRPATPQAKVSARDIDIMRRTIADKYALPEDTDHYTLLGLPFRATQKEIYYSFTTLCSLFHPDLALKPEFADLKRELETVFERLEQAYQTLVHVEKRKRYDRARGFS